MTTTTNPLQAAREALEHVRRELTIANAAHAAAGHELGDALARTRTGDKGAKTEAGKISMRRATIETDRDRLQLEERALTERIAALAAATEAETLAGAPAAFAEIDDHARELERQLAEVMRSAAAIAGELRAVRPVWEAAATQARKAGHVITTDPPRRATAFMKQRAIDDIEGTIATWQAPSLARFLRERGPAGPPRYSVGRGAGMQVLETIRTEVDSLGFMILPGGGGLPDANVTYASDARPRGARGILSGLRTPKAASPASGVETRGGKA